MRWAIEGLYLGKWRKLFESEDYGRFEDYARKCTEPVRIVPADDGRHGGRRTESQDGRRERQQR